MSNIVADLRWYGSTKSSLKEQTIPTFEELQAFGAEDIGETLEEGRYYNPERDSLPEGRDSRLWNICSKEFDTYLMYIPDRKGFFLEDFTGSRWRPQNLEECQALVDEIGFQLNRYGELI